MPVPFSTPFFRVGDTYFDTFFPGAWRGIGARLSFGGDVTGGGTMGGVPGAFYAATIRPFSITVGWLDPSAKP